MQSVPHTLCRLYNVRFTSIEASCKFGEKGQTSAKEGLHICGMRYSVCRSTKIVHIADSKVKCLLTYRPLGAEPNFCTVSELIDCF